MTAAIAACLFTDVFAAASPHVAARAKRLWAMVAHTLDRLGVGAGCIALPTELVARALAAQPLLQQERSAFDMGGETRK